MVNDLILTINIPSNNYKCLKHTYILTYIVFSLLSIIIIAYKLKDKQNITIVIASSIINILFTTCILYILCCYFSERILSYSIALLIIIGLTNMLYFL